ncbi:MAG: hypothetical protein ACYSOZ_02880, partial [Planctomycetota bacterium]
VAAGTSGIGEEAIKVENSAQKNTVAIDTFRLSAVNRKSLCITVPNYTFSLIRTLYQTGGF